MSSVDTPLHGSSGSELGSSYGENSSGPNSSAAVPSGNSSTVFDVLPIPIRKFQDDDEDDGDYVGDIDVDAPLSAEDQNLLNQITEFESSESDLESVTRDRKELFASPLLMTAMSLERQPEGASARAYRSQQEALLWEKDNATNFAAPPVVNSPPRQGMGTGVSAANNIGGNGAAGENQGEVNTAKPNNPYRRKEVWVAAAVVALSALAVGIAVPVIKLNRKNDTKAATPRPTFPPQGRKTFAPSRDPLAPPTPLGNPSRQTSGPIGTTPVASPSPNQPGTKSPSNSATSSPSKVPFPTHVPSNVASTTNPNSISSTPTHTPTVRSSSPTQAPTNTTSSSASPSLAANTPPPTLTANITISSQPTQATPSSTSPSYSPFQSNRRGDITSLIFDISGVFVFLDNNSPQSKAYQWILNTDPMQLLATDVPAIIQRYTLATLYYSTDSSSSWLTCGPQGTKTSCTSDDRRFLSNSSECQWYGVVCLGTNITSLNFRLNGIQGPLPPELGELSSLTQLTFSRNSISSTIPVALSKLTLLQTLLLNRNNLTGTIPSELGLLSSIQYLHLGINQLTGTIPSEIFSASMQNIDLGVNKLRGTIPNLVSLSPGLINIDLSSNMLTGPIIEFGRLTSLNSLALDNNFLTGNITSAVIATTTTAFTIGANNLSGTISEAFFAQGKALTTLNLGNNTIQGTLSSRIGELSNLAELFLWFNLFTGTIPTQLGELNLLGNLELAGNKFNGNVPSEVCALRSGQLSALSSDCGGSFPSIGCSCCTLCL